MQVQLAVLCDYATRTHDNKLVLIGLFDSIRIATLPAKHPAMTLAFKVHVRSGEEGEHEVKLRLVDPDGGLVMEMSTKLDMNVADPIVGETAEFVLEMHGMEFKQSGGHAFDIFVDGRYEETVPLNVVMQK